ncbi:hypothetical protein MKEN_00210700 [Mycena kentingensis (nom. inval.)]|nr:hypothetical protein MKEN_00210700 [Mycena kentingensis (nom. inval.)]
MPITLSPHFARAGIDPPEYTHDLAVCPEPSANGGPHGELIGWREDFGGNFLGRRVFACLDKHAHKSRKAFFQVIGRAAPPSTPAAATSPSIPPVALTTGSASVALAAGSVPVAKPQCAADGCTKLASDRCVNASGPKCAGHCRNSGGCLGFGLAAHRVTAGVLPPTVASALLQLENLRAVLLAGSPSPSSPDHVQSSSSAPSKKSDLSSSLSALGSKKLASSSEPATTVAAPSPPSRVVFKTIMWHNNTDPAIVRERSADAASPFWLAPFFRQYHVYLPSLHDWRRVGPDFQHRVSDGCIVVVRAADVIGVDEREVFWKYFHDRPPNTPIPAPIQRLPSPIPVPQRFPSPPLLIDDDDNELPTPAQLYANIYPDRSQHVLPRCSHVIDLTGDSDGDANESDSSESEVEALATGTKRKMAAHGPRKRARLVIDTDVAHAAGPSSLASTPALTSASSSRSEFTFPPSPTK